MVGDLSADLKANRPNPLIILVLVIYRYGNWAFCEFRVPILKELCLLLYRILDLLFVRAMCGAEIDAGCKIGPGLRLPHGANGIVIHKKSVIGRNVTIYHQVTLGGRNDTDSHPPTVGNNVEIFAGAKLLGSVKIGDGATIGANAVVIKDVPAFCVAVGVPARVIERRSDIDPPKALS
jgi:serine O-acetyltransferase